MEITHQIVLNDNLIINPKGGWIGREEDENFFVAQSLSMEEILNLEIIYNMNCNFPVSLRELLFLAGKYCHVLDYGLSISQQEMQDEAREWLIDYGFNITRPFYVIDVHRGPSTFLFVYLDESSYDPIVYEANLDNSLTGYFWITDLQAPLSSFVNARIDYLKRGFNPF